MFFWMGLVGFGCGGGDWWSGVGGLSCAKPGTALVKYNCILLKFRVYLIVAKSASSDSSGNGVPNLKFVCTLINDFDYLYGFSGRE
jgi:hypothetical protein